MKPKTVKTHQVLDDCQINEVQTADLLQQAADQVLDDCQINEVQTKFSEEELKAYVLDDCQINEVQTPTRNRAKAY